MHIFTKILSSTTVFSIINNNKKKKKKKKGLWISNQHIRMIFEE